MIDWLRGLRTQLGLTQSEFAERLGVTRCTISRWENGRVQPNRLTVAAISALVGATSSSKLDSGIASQMPHQDPHYSHEANSRIAVPELSLTDEGVPHRLLKGPRTLAFSDGAGRAETLRKCPLFSGLDGDQLVELSRLAAEHHVKAGQILYLEDEALDYFYIVAEGRVKILRHSLSGKDFILGFCTEGAIIGNLSLMSGKPHSSSAQAIFDTKVLAIKASAFLSFVWQHPQSGCRLLAAMLEIIGMRRLRTTRRLVDMATERVDHRVARTLLTLSLEFGLVLPFTCREIAEMSGTSTETTIRFMNYLKQKGIVSAARRKLSILDPASLTAWVNASA